MNRKIESTDEQRLAQIHKEIARFKCVKERWLSAGYMAEHEFEEDVDILNRILFLCDGFSSGADLGVREILKDIAQVDKAQKDAKEIVPIFEKIRSLPKTYIEEIMREYNGS